MPYIPPERRSDLPTTDLADEIASPGELNYVLSAILWRTDLGTGYEAVNAKLGVLSAVSQEFYRRVIAPYEDLKIAKNGDLDVEGTEG